jgi:magnesium-transporting ATPase (P-type)
MMSCKGGVFCNFSCADAIERVRKSRTIVDDWLTELGVVLILRTRGPAWRSRPSALLLWTTVAATAFALAIPFFGRGSALFGFVPLSTVEMATVVGIVIAYLAATEVAKRWFFRAGGPMPA